MSAYIKGFPFKFHDLVEVFEFLINLPPVYLYMFDGFIIYYCNIPRLQIRILWKNGCTFVSYRTLKMI